MKIKDILKIESIIDKRETPSDILEFLDQTYYSKSKDEHIKYDDIHITHFIRIFINKNGDDSDEIFKTRLHNLIQLHNESVEDGSYYKKHPEIKPPKDSNGR